MLDKKTGVTQQNFLEKILPVFVCKSVTILGGSWEIRTAPKGFLGRCYKSFGPDIKTKSLRLFPLNIGIGLVLLIINAMNIYLQ